ncbi:MAG: Na+/H+ antiporter NhaA [Atopobiaceae bacterium]|nr:Na+/H+ antiporter NhaA [Atopobiaceae bacterium]
MRTRRKAQKITSNGTIAAGVMVIAALAAILVANSPAYETVQGALNMPIGMVLGPVTIDMSIAGFVNNFLMTIFFLLVGVELKYEVTVGQLKQPRQAILPIVAAIGGVVVPCLIYLALNRHSDSLHGWAVPMATDIAFALGVMSLLGDRISPATKVFFSTLAIADDILAILVIALAYGHSPDLLWLGAAAIATVVLVMLNRAGVYGLRLYTVVGIVLWACMYKSGIEPTLAGVIFAFTLPGRTDIQASAMGDWLSTQAHKLDDQYEAGSHILGQHDFTERAYEVERIMHHVTPPLQRIERYCSTAVNFFILPLFAFVNAQVRLVDADFAMIVADPVTRGVFFGAVMGKPIGIISATGIMVGLRVAKLPRGMGWDQLVGVGLMGGLGFTMSILIAGLAFHDPTEILAAKLAILVGSLAAGVIGCVFLLLASSSDTITADE